MRQGWIADLRAVGLQRNVELTMPHEIRTLDDPLWDSPEWDWNPGWIALKDSVTQAKGLPLSMQWPWDKTKGIYLIHGFHSMHCVVSVLVLVFSQLH